MTDGKKIAKAVLATASEISKKEKEKAIQNENYGDAIVASIFQGLFQELSK